KKAIAESSDTRLAETPNDANTGPTTLGLTRSLWLRIHDSSVCESNSTARSAVQGRSPGTSWHRPRNSASTSPNAPSTGAPPGSAPGSKREQVPLISQGDKPPGTSFE